MNIAIKFDRDFFSFDYDKIPVKFRASEKEDSCLVVYRGAVKIADGFLSSAFRRGVAKCLVGIKECIESGIEQRIANEIARHCMWYSLTPFLSATYNPSMAQQFAPTNP